MAKKTYTFHQFIFSIFIICFALLQSSCGSHSTSKNRVVVEASDTLPNPFFVYDFYNNFGMEKFTIQEEFDFIKEIGFNGVTIPINNAQQLRILDSVQQRVDIENGDLKLYAVFYVIHLDDDGLPTFWKTLLPRLKQSNTSLWLIVTGKNENDEKLMQILGEMIRMAEAQNTEIVFYPHDNTYIQSAEEALPLVQHFHSKYFTLSLHLCHELRAGNRHRMTALIKKVAPYVSLASISGADTVYRDTGKWDDTIKPLDEGAYNVKDFLIPLIKSGFKGPIALHTNGIEQDPKDHFKRSFEVWKKMSAEIASVTKSQSMD